MEPLPLASEVSHHGVCGAGRVLYECRWSAAGLFRELARRRRERAALEAAREAAAARQAEASGRARMETEYGRYLDWRQRGVHAQLGRARRDAGAAPTPGMEAARRWASADRQAFLQQRAAKDSMLAEWRRAKDQQQRGEAGQWVWPRVAQGAKRS